MLTTNPGEKGDDPGLSPTDWALWDMGQVLRLSLPRHPKKVMEHTPGLKSCRVRSHRLLDLSVNGPRCGHGFWFLTMMF